MNSWKFSKSTNKDVEFFTIPAFDEAGGVKHCFTTRIGGVSGPPYESLNLGMRTEDSRQNVFKNYGIICKALDIDVKNLVLSHQTHSDNILIACNEHRGNGIFYDTRFSEIDGLITNKKDVALVTFYADCVPIFILDKKRRVIALAHSGWRGTVKKIGKKVIDRMISAFNTEPKDCVIGIGPSIGKCCYEVDDYVINQFKDSYSTTEKFIKEKGKGKYHLDLWEANKLLILESGVPYSNITISGICTRCNNDLFFSYRGENGKTGRMAAIIQLI